MTDILGTARKAGITVEVHPGGALSSLTLTDHALAAGTRALAESILAAVAEATTHANQRTRHTFGDALTVLGVPVDHDLVEVVESTTPDSWRV
jgi:DNA-binding protein YbaB